jgi:hypothetical protein
MTEHWSYPVAIGGKALLHFLLPEQSLFMVWASEATLANGAIGSLLEKAEKDDGLHGLESKVKSLAAR